MCAGRQKLRNISDKYFMAYDNDAIILTYRKSVVLVDRIIIGLYYIIGLKIKD